MAGAGDPVATGLVENLARPGGNVTGLSSGGTEVAGQESAASDPNALGPERPIEADANTLISLPLSRRSGRGPIAAHSQSRRE
jgi:hypothetical protein